MNMDIPRSQRPARERARPCILIVDDATVIRMYYRQLLESEGYQVEEAINGIEGLEKAHRQSFDLCIVDVNMPMMDGHEFLAALRADPATQSLPALVTTTQGSEEDRRAALAAGADDYMVKPVPEDLFALHVAALLGRPAR